MTGNISGFEKRKELESEEAREIQRLAGVLSPAELTVIVAFRELRPFSTLKVVMNQSGRGASVFVTHETKTAIDTQSDGDTIKSSER